MKNLSVKFRRAAEAEKVEEKMENEFKIRETQLLAIIKEKEDMIKKKDAMIKEKESEIINLNNVVTQVNHLASKYKESKLNLNNLKRRGQDNNKINNQKPDHDLSKLSFSFNLQNEMNQPTGKRCRSSDCMSLERLNSRDSQFPRFKKPSVPKFIPNKNFFTLEDSNVEESFDFPGINDEFMCGIRYNKSQQCFRPLSISTQRYSDILPAMSQDTSVISEVPYFDSLRD